MEIEDLNEVFFSRLRLAILVNLLKTSKSFKELKEETATSDGNLAVQLKKLEKSGIITSDKQIVTGKVNNTFYSITETGRRELLRYIESLEDVISDL